MKANLTSAAPGQRIHGESQHHGLGSENEMSLHVEREDSGEPERQEERAQS